MYCSPRRLLGSLERADYGGDRIELFIMVDHSNDNADVINASHAFEFSHGRKTVDVATVRKGLRQMWFDAWTPMDDSHFGCIIEDDIEMSPQWHVWLKAAWKAYGNRTDINGISLSRQTVVPKNPRPRDREVVNEHKPFLYAMVGSWGFSPHPKQWSSFLTWIKTIDLKTYDVSTPGLVTSNWWNTLDKTGIWTQYYIYFSKKHDIYTLYVNLPDKTTLAAHHREKGVHYPTSLGPDFKLATSVNKDFPSQLVKYGWNAKPMGDVSNLLPGETMDNYKF